MKIATKVVYNWNDRLGRYILVSDESFEYSGPIFTCKGASQQQNQILNSQQSFMNTLQKDFGTSFQGQQNIINSLTSALQPILSGGPSQFGFSAPEVSALNSAAINNTAAGVRNAQQAAGEASASTAGGNAVLPTNAAAQTQAGIAQAGAQQQSNQLLGIQQAGWQQGNQNFNNAVGGITNAGNMESPGTYANASNTAGSDAAGNASQIQQMNNAASPWNTIGGILGGIGSAALGVATGGASTALQGLGGAFNAINAGNQGIQGLAPVDSTSGAGMIPQVPMQGFNF
jgi:hypothetical protein